MNLTSAFRTNRLFISIPLKLFFSFCVFAPPCVFADDLSCYDQLFQSHSVTLIPVPARKTPSFNRIPRARLYRSRIADNLQRGVDFGGHYNIAKWGCGIGCCGMAITDTVSGEVAFYSPNLTKNFLSTSCSWEYRQDSNVLIMNGICNRATLDSQEVRNYYDQSGPRAYLWNGHDFETIAGKSYCSFDGPEKCF